MYSQQRPLPQLYNTSPYAIPVYGNIAYQVAPLDINWYSTWPSAKSICLSVVMIICSTTIISLDIANLAIEGNKQNGTSKLGSGTGQVGVGIWSGFIYFLTAIFILGISKYRYLLNGISLLKN
jgi:hypothetical protein